MAKFLMAIGLPASGKDTLYERELTKEYIHISSDGIRAEFGDVNDQTKNDKVFDLMYKRTVAELANDNNVYYNATNLSQKRRIHLLNSLKAKFGDTIEYNCVFLSTPYMDCVKRNAERKRSVPKYVLERMIKSFMPPAYAEGWNNIYIYNTGCKSVDLNALLREAKFIPHDNPHHMHSIGFHMYIAADLYKSEHDMAMDEIWLALKYHDIGKCFCKTYTDFKGNPTPHAHYYGHECVSAYYYLTSDLPPDYTFFLYNTNISNLIAHHMDHFKGEKYLAKVAALYGDEFMKKLSILHDYDLAAH